MEKKENNTENHVNARHNNCGQYEHCVAKFQGCFVNKVNTYNLMKASLIEKLRLSLLAVCHALQHLCGQHSS
jgi:hypothetical protein